MPELIERVSDFIVFVNEYPYSRTELWNAEKGITRIYGIDGDKEKINYVKYPKRYYTREYMENNILPKYDSCPICTIGRNISFKYNKNKNTINKKIKGNLLKMRSLRGMLGKLNDPIKKEYIGQGLGALARFGISNITTELGNKIINTAIGAIGNIINETRFRNDGARAAFTHMMFAFADPTANQVREMKRNAGDLVNGLRARSFGSAFGSLLEEPQEVVNAWKSLININGFGSKLRGMSGKLGKSFKTSGQSQVFQTEPKKRGIVSTYGIPIDDRDLVSY